MNKLFFGDNLTVLEDHIENESIDLIYLDPPFNSETSYNLIYPAGGSSQMEAFKDTWEWDKPAAKAFDKVIENGGETARLLSGLKLYLGTNGTLAYASQMAIRLQEMRKKLKPTGVVFLHCDHTASHYLRLLLDSIFGADNFRNEIYWYYYNKMHDSRKKLLPNATDTIFFYAKDKSSSFTFNRLKEMRDKPVRQLMRKKVGGKIVNARDAAGELMYQVKTDKTLDNVWRIPMLQPASAERMGYPTQKPVALLRRIIELASKPGDLVLDPFCGCGTTIEAAESLGREWVGIDVTHYAVTLIERRLAKWHPAAEFKVQGRPTDLAGAHDLARRSKHQFQWWASWLLGAQRYREEKLGADKGIDGRIMFRNGPFGDGNIIISVKGGENVSVQMVRDLRGTIEREGAEMGVLITLAEPTAPMRVECASAGFVRESAHGRLPRLQVVTVEQLLKGVRPELPPLPLQERVPVAGDRSKPKPSDQMEMVFTFEGGKPTTTEGEVIDPRFLELGRRPGRGAAI